MTEISRVYFEKNGVMRCSVDNKRIKPYVVASDLRTIKVENVAGHPIRNLDKIVEEILRRDEQVPRRVNAIAVSEYNPDTQFTIQTEDTEQYSVYAYQFYSVMDIGHNHLNG